MIKLIKPNWPVPAHVKAVSTTRLGGTSGTPFDSLNLGDHVGDMVADVAKNRSVLLAQLGLDQEPFWLQQTHSNTLVYADEAAESNCADASTARGSSRACVVMTADCLPLLLCNAEGTQVAAVHAGWRGLADGIIERAVEAFDCVTSSLIAWVGPCIGPSAFEVGLEVKAQLGGPEQAYLSHSDPQKVYANLPALAEQRLADLGVSQCYQSGLCTFSDPDRFYSYRRDGQTGRMATLIWIDQP